MNVMEAIRGRHSTRKYRSDDVSEEQVTALLEAARWAPSWANTQCWRFVVVRDPETKGRIADALRRGNPASEAVRTAPLLIVICIQLGRSGFYKGEAATCLGEYGMFDAGVAMQNLALAAHDMGLGTVHVALMDIEQIERILGVPEGVRVIELTPIGYPVDEPHGPGRRELDELVFHERYGQK